MTTPNIGDWTEEKAREIIASASWVNGVTVRNTRPMTPEEFYEYMEARGVLIGIALERERVYNPKHDNLEGFCSCGANHQARAEHLEVELEAERQRVAKLVEAADKVPKSCLFYVAPYSCETEKHVSGLCVNCNFRKAFEAYRSQSNHIPDAGKTEQTE